MPHYTLDEKTTIETRLVRLVESKFGLRHYTETIMSCFNNSCDSYEIPANRAWEGEPTTVKIAHLSSLSELYSFIANNRLTASEAITAIKAQADALGLDY